MDKQGNRIHILNRNLLEMKGTGVDSFYTFARNEAAAKRINAWLGDQNIRNADVGVVAVQSEDGETLNAYAKIVILGGGGSFLHEEPYNIFPSDHLKTKILMATGGA